MAFAGLIFIGLLFGIVLSASVVGFIVVRSGGPLKESLFGDGAGRPAFEGVPATAVAAGEAERRQKITEELRVAHKLLDQCRVERVEADAAAASSAAEITALRKQLADREAMIESLQGAAAGFTAGLEALRTELAARTEELANVSMQLEDTRLELDVKESGSAFTTSQINRLQQERDELAALVDQLRPAAQAAQQRMA